MAAIAGMLRRQPRSPRGFPRCVEPAMTQLDRETFAILDAAARRHGVTKSYALAEITRQWARSQGEGDYRLPIGEGGRAAA